MCYKVVQTRQKVLQVFYHDTVHKRISVDNFSSPGISLSAETYQYMAVLMLSKEPEYILSLFNV